MNLIDEIFKNEPDQWGLRGDPYLWHKLKRSLLPLENGLSQIDFEQQLECSFNKIIDQEGKRTSEEVVWFKNFPESGMSGGYVSLIWWQETGLPLIKGKYKELISRESKNL